MEELTRRIADVVNTAGVENRQDLREYAIELLKEQTERSDAPSAPSKATNAGFNPLGIALLLGLVSLPLLLLFAPVGLAMFALAGVIGLWGLLATLFHR